MGLNLILLFLETADAQARDLCVKARGAQTLLPSQNRSYAHGEKLFLGHFPSFKMIAVSFSHFSLFFIIMLLVARTCLQRTFMRSRLGLTRISDTVHQASFGEYSPHLEWEWKRLVSTAVLHKLCSRFCVGWSCFIGANTATIDHSAIMQVKH